MLYLYSGSKIGNIAQINITAHSSFFLSLTHTRTHTYTHAHIHARTGVVSSKPRTDAHYNNSLIGFLQIPTRNACEMRNKCILPMSENSTERFNTFQG